MHSGHGAGPRSSKKLAIFPSFAFPPKEYFLAAGIDQVPNIARDPTAEAFVRFAIEIGRKHGGSPPSVLMLRAALDLAGIPYETLPIETFGSIVSMSSGPIGKA